MFSMYQGGTHVEVFDAGTTKFCTNTTTTSTTSSRGLNASSGACGDDDSSKKSSKSLFAASNTKRSRRFARRETSEASSGKFRTRGKRSTRGIRSITSLPRKGTCCSWKTRPLKPSFNNTRILSLRRKRDNSRSRWCARRFTSRNRRISLPSSLCFPRLKRGEIGGEWFSRPRF